jgi:hypothetical protein
MTEIINEAPIAIIATGPEMNEMLLQNGLIISAIIAKDIRGRKNMNQMNFSHRNCSHNIKL